MSKLVRGLVAGYGAKKLGGCGCGGLLLFILFRHAQRQGLFRKPVPPAVYRWAAMLSISPVVAFLLSIPVAFADTGLAVFVWFLAIPFQVIAARYKPEDADEYL